MSGFQGVVGALASIGFANQSAPVILGSVTLTGVEIPSRLRVSGEQGLVTTTLPGGARIIQAMGPNPAGLSWSGMFVGPNAKSRSLLFAKIRDAGAPITLSVAQLSLQVVLKSYDYTIQDKGAICPYTIAMEILPTTASAATTQASSLQALVGTDLAASITNVTNTIATVSAEAQTAIAQGQTIIGQAMPLATLVGLGGPLSKVSTLLQGANFYAQAGTDFAAAPSAAATMITNIQGASASLMDTISDASLNLTGLQGAANAGDIAGSPAALQAMTGNAQVLSSAVDTGASVNRAAGNAALALSAPALPPPDVYAE